MPTACQRFFDIPELIASLDPFLGNNDRIQILTTSRSLHKVFAPLVWSRLDMKPTVTAARLLKSPEGIQALARYVGSVQSFEASSFFFKAYMDGVLAFAHIQRLESLFLSDAAAAEEEGGGGGRGGGERAITGTGTVLARPNWLPATQNRRPDIPMFPTPPMRNLTQLNCSITRLDMDGDKLGLCQSFQICWLLRLNPGLTDLHLTNMALSNAQLIRVLARTLSRLSKLRDLYLESSCDMSMQLTRMLFLSCPVSLVVLSLHFNVEDIHPGVAHDLDSNNLQDATDDNSDDDDDEEGLSAAVRRSGPLHNLTRLIMPTHRGGFPTSTIELFLQDCPSLQMWGVPNLEHPQTSREVSNLLLHHCPKLRQLTVKDGSSRRRDYLEVIRDMPVNQLETLAVIRYSEGEPGELWEVLERHRDVFHQLILFNALKVSSRTIQCLLRFCPRLTRLFMMAVDDRELSLSLGDAAEYPWTCLNLTHVCLLMDLSGTGAEEKYATALRTKKSGTTTTLPPFVWKAEEQACWKQLETVYTQLGSLVRLDTLTIRYVNPFDRDYLSKSLPGLLTLGDPSMNQPGFLKKLAGLKKLRMFRGSVSAFTAESQMMLRQREVEWMMREWPALEVIDFLGSKGGGGGNKVDLPVHLQWFQSRKPSIKFH
ncbi:hypothetical protein BG015_001772 [Linnemannia schmuckeri]|uniref:Uncharacterized protein n=1 Tax=Linnemannia schmuckeri TaxID=64567 RepID=A0A9P5S5U9_9FUNG|nr:hypothetical protein BG015_001772 [Linnemannia schmuckeri]